MTSSQNTFLSSPHLPSSLSHSSETPYRSILQMRDSSNPIVIDVATTPENLSVNDSSAGDSASSASSKLRGSFEYLSWRLRRFDYLLEALNDLRSEFFTASGHLLPDEELWQSASMIMDLLDIAKETLEGAGVDLWPHSLCFVGLRRHKKAYFALLKLLKSREDCLTSQLLARSRRLTCRLSTNFSIPVNPAYDLYLPPKSLNPKQKIQQPLQNKKFSMSMPPPDAFPPSDFIPISSRSCIGPQRCRRRMRLEFSSDIWESLQSSVSESKSSRPTPDNLGQSLHGRHGSLGSRRPGSTSLATAKQWCGIFSTSKGNASALNKVKTSFSRI
ncbi:hypothetical protein FB446DRAFT_476094 [Lentinula raphanica]|nr:hypothetical protein FB446DRAFT_476094 [Lentinula raphanica]